MKHFLIFILSLLSFGSFSQSVPQFINYQAVLRDANNQPFPVGSNLTLRFEIFNNETDNIPSYIEEHSVTVPPTFVINRLIGKGMPQSGTFSTSITWTTGTVSYLVKVDGSIVSPKQQFATVPYAMNSRNGAGSKNYIAGNGITISGDTIKNSAPNQTVNITGSAVSGTYPSYVINSTAGVGSITAGSNITLTNTASNYTIGTPNYSISYPNSGLSVLTNGSSTTTAVIPQPNLTLAGLFNNILSAGANSVALNTYSPGNGIAISGVAPNFGISLGSTGTNVAWNSLGNGGTNPSINFIGTTDFTDLVFRTSGNQRMIIKNGGFVNIGGGSATTENLQLESPTNTTLSILSSTISYLNFGNNSNHSLGGIRYDNFSNAMSFSTNGNTRMQIDGNGRVGIGVVPAEPLHVVGKTRTDSIQIRGPISPTVQSVLVSRDSQGNAKWAAPINFKGTFAPAAPIGVGTTTITNIGNIIGYSSGVIFNNTPTLGLVYNNSGGFYTVPETGVYYFDASIMVAINSSGSGNNYLVLEIFNSTTSTVLQKVMQSNADDALTLNTVLKATTTAMVNKGDVIILRVVGSTGTAGTIQNTFPSTNKMNSFSGFLLR